MGDKIIVEEVPDVPSGTFYAKVVKHEPYKGKYDPATRIFFMIKIKDHAVGPINGIFPLRATVANKTGKLLFATLGECTVGLAYDLDSLINKHCWVEVIRAVTEDGPVSRVKLVYYPAPAAAAVEGGSQFGAPPPGVTPTSSDGFEDKSAMPF